MFKILFSIAFAFLTIPLLAQQKKSTTKRHLCTMFGEIVTGEPLVASGDLLWKKKQVAVYFFDGDSDLKNKVLNIANNWAPFSGVRFVRSYNQYTSDIRVSFRTNGWWSYIGSSSQKVGLDSVTLSLDSLFLYPSHMFKSVVLHEFGHSLGLLHEHQHPFIDIKWKLPELYTYYRDNYGVDSNWVWENVLEKYSAIDGIYCSPDKNSIMIYALPDFVLEEGPAINEPLELSTLDKQNIKRIYRREKCN